MKSPLRQPLRTQKTGSKRISGQLIFCVVKFSIVSCCHVTVQTKCYINVALPFSQNPRNFQNSLFDLSRHGRARGLFGVKLYAIFSSPCLPLVHILRSRNKLHKSLRHLRMSLLFPQLALEIEILRVFLRISKCLRKLYYRKTHQVLPPITPFNYGLVQAAATKSRDQTEWLSQGNDCSNADRRVPKNA